MQHSSWHALIKGQLPEGYFGKINQFMEQIYAQGTVYPPKEKVFQALLTTPLEEVKVVILGQDPYHGTGQAQGLSFSVPASIPAPPSLQNILKELSDDIGVKKSHDLTPLNFDNNLAFLASLTKNQDLKRENFTQVQQLVAGSEVFENFINKATST